MFFLVFTRSSFSLWHHLLKFPKDEWHNDVPAWRNCTLDHTACPNPWVFIFFSLIHVWWDANVQIIYSNGSSAMIRTSLLSIRMIDDPCDRDRFALLCLQDSKQQSITCCWDLRCPFLEFGRGEKHSEDE